MFALFALAHAEDLYVSSNERGAAILLNGVDTGFKTPATVPGVQPGRTLVTVESGCSRGEAEVDVLPGLTTRASIVATEQLGTLSIVPVPAAAKLELDGAAFLGSPGVPLAVSCGEHTVRASLDGHITAVVTVEVGMGQDLTVPLSLQKLGLGTLELSVSPRSATIYLDGKAVGSDAVTLPSVYQGVHTIAAELDGYQSAKKQVVVEDGSAQAWHFELVRASQKRQASKVTRLGGGPEAASATTTGKGAGAVPTEAPSRDAARREAAAREAAEREATEKAEREASEKAEREAAKREAAAIAAREAAQREAAEREAAEAAEQAEREAAEAAEAEREAAQAAAQAEILAAEREAADREAAEQAEREAAEQAEREAEAAEREAAKAAKREAAEREAAKREAAKAEARTEGTSAGGARVERDLPVGKTVGGIALLAAGVGGGVYSWFAYEQASRAYDSYGEKLDEAGADKQRQRLADDYYDDNVVPRQTLFYGSAVGTTLFLAGGVLVLVVDERAPTFVPAPGGGMLQWSGRF